MKSILPSIIPLFARDIKRYVTRGRPRPEFAMATEGRAFAMDHQGAAMNVTGMTKRIMAAGLVACGILSTGVPLTGCMTDDKDDTTGTAAKHTPFGAATTVMIGAQGNTAYGSAVDLDTKKVMLSDAALAAQGTIDIVFIYSNGDLQIASPVYAKAAGDVPLAANYDASKIKDTQFARISTLPEDSEQAITIFAQTPNTDNAIILEGVPYLVKTDKGKLVSIMITDLQGTDNTASAKLTIALSGL
jgi:hypothetical protein